MSEHDAMPPPDAAVVPRYELSYDPAYPEERAENLTMVVRAEDHDRAITATQQRIREVEVERDVERAHLQRQLTAAQEARHQAEQRAKGLDAAIDRTREYIRIAIRPISIKEACGETAYDRAERHGLQHGLNALNAEVAKADSRLPPEEGR